MIMCTASIAHNVITDNHSKLLIICTWPFGFLVYLVHINGEEAIKSHLKASNDFYIGIVQNNVMLKYPIMA